jgi:hypothetical protein
MSSLSEIERYGKVASHVEWQPSLGAVEYRQRGPAENLARHAISQVGASEQAM